MAVRIGTRDSKTLKYPKVTGFKNVVCLTPSTPYGNIGPYCLKDDDGCIMENLWQFSKVYKQVPYTKERYSQYNSTIIWEHPKETHVDLDGNLTEEFWEWRNKGLKNEYPVRYPVSIKYRASCMGCLPSHDEKGTSYEEMNTKELLNYVDSRKQIYLPLYVDLVKKTDTFKKLKTLLDKGKNLLILEVDGPRHRSMQHYKDTYGVSDDFIEVKEGEQEGTILCTQENMNLLINDTQERFGHGYCLAMALLDIQVE